MTTEPAYVSRSVFEPEGYRAPPQSAVSWGAIWAGASVALASGMILSLAAGGLGYTVSYSGLASRTSLANFTPIAGAVAMAVQVLSAAFGGYVAGRLRTTWVGVHGDETHFRDTAHGLIAWAVATLLGVLFAAIVLSPYADALAAATAPPLEPPTPDEALRMANLAAQSSLFIAVGMLLSGFVAAVAGRLGGHQHEHMHALVYRVDRDRV